MGRFTEILNDCAPTGSAIDVNLINGSINVDVTVADFISVTPSGTFYTSVTQSGAYLTILGSVNVNNNTAGSIAYIPAGSVLVTNPPYLGSTYTVSGTMDVLGSVAVTNIVSVIGSQAITNLPTNYPGSVWQGTNPWIVLGSTQVTNPPYLGSTFTVSGVQEVSQTDEFVPINKQYLTLVAGSPTATVGVFAQVVNHVNLSTMEGSMIAMLDGTAGPNSGLYFPAYSRDSFDCTCGSVSAYGINGSLFILGTW
jgi:hypothetical protein